MTQSQLNRAVSRATGEDCDLIDRHGFSLVEDECSVQEEDLLALVTDWQQLEAEHVAATRRQTPYASIA
jgi:hypothetical protein